jgi:integrase
MSAFLYLCEKMAAIKFLLQSVSNPANIYVRLIDGRRIDIKTKTNFVINPNDWSESKQRPKNLKNQSFKNLDFELNNLRANLLNYYNENKDETINLAWLKKFINPKDKIEIPKELVSYCDFYLSERVKELNPRIFLNIKVIQKKLIEIQKIKRKIYFLKDVDLNFKKEFEKYNLEHGYSENTILNNLKEIKGICFHAQKKGMQISTEINDIKTAQKKAVSVYLSFEELEKIEKTDLKIKDLQNARDWLLISCYTAQRVSDFMRFNPGMIRTEGNVKLIEFTQKKTGKIMTLPLHKKVIEILEKRNFEFPEKITDQKYNLLIKSVCRKAKIDDVVFGGKSVVIKTGKKKLSKTGEMIEEQIIRKIMGNYPKHELITSHVGRRSFATNFYGTIPTSLLISATGHSTEQMFLVYIGKSNSDKAMQLSNYF